VFCFSATQGVQKPFPHPGEPREARVSTGELPAMTASVRLGLPRPGIAGAHALWKVGARGPTARRCNTQGLRRSQVPTAGRRECWPASDLTACSGGKRRKATFGGIDTHKNTFSGTGFSTALGRGISSSK